MFKPTFGIVIMSVLFLSGCGTYTPDIQEFWGTPGDASIKVNKIAGQVTCELRKSVQQVYLDNEQGEIELVSAPGHPAPAHRNLDWFDKWGAQVTLNLNIIENSSATPGVSLTTILPNSITPFPVSGNIVSPRTYSTGLGATLSSTATRTDKLSMFFTVHDLKNGLPSTMLPCTPNRSANADLFTQSDLKLYDWLSAALTPYTTGIASYGNSSTDKNAISHEVKFEIVSNGSVTPTWHLARVSANTSGTLFAAGRDRTQDLTITFGPIDGGKKAPQLAAPAANVNLAIQIGLEVAQSVRGLQ